MESSPAAIARLRATGDQMVGPGSPFEMTEATVRGVAMRVFKNAPPNMRAIWDASAAFGDANYLVYEDEHMTYAQAHATVRALAHHLRDTHGVGPGDRVAVAMRNYPEWVFSYWAIVSLGAACVGMNAWWTSQEMEFGLKDSAPKVLIADGERLERVVPVLDSLRTDSGLAVIAVRVDGDLPDGVVDWNDVVDPTTAPAELPAADIDTDSDVCVFYTSGTTGFPKGAQLTHRSSIHNLMHIGFMPAMFSAAANAEPAAAEEAAPVVIMAPTPLFHVTANNCLLHPVTAVGATLVLTYKWDAARALELIEREKVTTMSGVPTMARELLQHPDWETRDTSSLTGLGGGGAPIPPDLVGKISEALPKGSPSTGYGLTETSGIVTSNSTSFYLAKPDSCGLVVPTCDAVTRDEMGNDLPVGEVGILWVKGPIVIAGYLNRPEATAEAIEDGWFDTGDIAKVDENGFLYIVDRAKDMVLRGGENIYCSEVEAAIYSHDAVAQVAVFGLPDERLGEIVAAAIVMRDGATMDEADLHAHLDGKLSKPKIPARVWFRTEPLPQNASGKFMKRELRAELIEG